MNIKESVKNKLGIEKLEDYIFDQYVLGKRDAELLVDEALNEAIIKIDKVDDDEIIVKNILSDLINLKTVYFSASFFEYHEIINGAKYKAVQNKIDISNEINEVKNISNFILDFYDNRQLSYISYFSNIKKVREKSKEYNTAMYFVTQTDFLFNKLNNLYKIEDFEWSWSNFEKGLIEVLNKNLANKRHEEIEKKYELQMLKITFDSDNKQLKNEIEYLNNEISSLKNKNANITNYYNYYYYSNQILIQNTYFGDNLPFLLNLYNFLKKNNLFDYGWSYFYSCMVIGNAEMIPLDSLKKHNFVGYFFFKLKDFLIMNFQDNYFNFFQSKFLLNKNKILDSFKPNYIKKDFDKQLYPELVKIDEFFKEQDKIYLKL